MLSNQLRRAGWMTVLVKNCRFGGGGAVSGSHSHSPSSRSRWGPLCCKAPAVDLHDLASNGISGSGGREGGPARAENAVNTGHDVGTEQVGPLVEWLEGSGEGRKMEGGRSVHSISPHLPKWGRAWRGTTGGAAAGDGCNRTLNRGRASPRRWQSSRSCATSRMPDKLRAVGSRSPYFCNTCSLNVAVLGLRCRCQMPNWTWKFSRLHASRSATYRRMTRSCSSCPVISRRRGRLEIHTVRICQQTSDVC
jgi:hypothetical protein